MTYAKPTALTAALAMALGAAWAPAAVAQTGQQQRPPQQQQRPPQQQQPPAQTESFDESELKSYATAALQVQQIRQSYAPRMQSTESREEQEKLQQEAMTKMSEAVQGEGLDVETYNKITTAVQNDPNLANQVHNLMAEQQ